MELFRRIQQYKVHTELDSDKECKLDIIYQLIYDVTEKYEYKVIVASNEG